MVAAQSSVAAEHMNALADELVLVHYEELAEQVRHEMMIDGTGYWSLAVDDAGHLVHHTAAANSRCKETQEAAGIGAVE